MYTKQYRFRLEGISPLILHWDNIEWADQIDAARFRIKKEDSAAFKAGDDRCPPETWKGYVYNDGTHVAIPNDNLRASLMKAAARIELKGKKTFKELSQCAVLFDDEFLTFDHNGKQIPIAAINDINGVFAEHAAAVRELGFSLLVKRARVGSAKHVRVRPKFETWSVEGTLTVVDKQVTAEILEDMFRIAGLYIGLCDWRPGSPRSPGPYGRFTTTVKVA